MLIALTKRLCDKLKNAERFSSHAIKGPISMAHQEREAAAQAPHKQDWHTVNREDLERRLNTGRAGLAEAEAARRLAEHGFNRLAPPKRQGPLLRFALQFHNILLYVMLGAALRSEEHTSELQS